MKKINKWALITLLSFLVSACSLHPDHVQMVNQQPDIYPDYIGVTIPVDIAPLNFSMTDDDFTDVYVDVKGEKGGSIHAEGTYADFDVDEWHQLLKANKGSRLLVSVMACREGNWYQYRDFSIEVSPNPLDEWGITYRRIAPSYALYGHMGLYQRCLSDFTETSMLENSQVHGQCMNCHTQNRTNPEQYVFHVRGEHGATVVHQHGKDVLLKARNDSLGGTMVYPYWHPSGRYCAFSTNKTAQMFHTGNNKRIEVFDTSSDVFVYDMEKHEVIKDTLIMTTGWAENTPAFSPDGKWLYFTTVRCGNYPKGYDQVRYSLCRVAFDEKSGKIGTEVDTLVNAGVTGKSVTWPRPSYDGKYLMYTQLDYGYFSVWHPEADLYMLDLETGVNRPLNEVNSIRSESLHNWTRNSRWFLFTSRREDGLYTRLYFSSVDEHGKATKPFLLPQQNPKEYYQRLMYSYNTPDFTSVPVKTNAREMGRKIERF
ncbi:cytochrome c-binding protein [Xylanibacter ruminicola]|uniref:Lipoprotein n=2 Tax=Xylanibacter ruminicola TaxID=839 RepID=D5EY27_XYLR2|nr:PD40 domain-containing protein [Xylanibacter ruminicola]ADE81009.1 putative lipoprotein [Xylanibacter ruminicola 23]GJG32212.1 cytochrome c-binding protein [Xylanibacter ruminicola]SEH83245.1 WD40-like Beta Propeller Repeat [Xylanibacter ruminicola]